MMFFIISFAVKCDSHLLLLISLETVKVRFARRIECDVQREEICLSEVREVC